MPRDTVVVRATREVLGLMVVTRADGTVLTLNPAWTATLSWTEAELLGSSLFELVHPDDQEAAALTWDRLGPGAAVCYENRSRTKDEEFRWLSWIAVSEVGLIHGVARDVTSEKDRAEELRLAREAL